MPAGTIGFRASGQVDVEEYKRVLLPPIERAVDAGSVRLLFQAGPDFEKFDAAALWADARESIDLGLRHHSAWKRFALVTDVDWMARTTQLFAWAVPGEVRVYRLGEGGNARSWLAG